MYEGRRDLPLPVCRPELKVTATVHEAVRVLVCGFSGEGVGWVFESNVGSNPFHQEGTEEGRKGSPDSEQHGQSLGARAVGSWRVGRP